MVVNRINRYYYSKKISIVKSVILFYLIFWTINCTLISLLPEYDSSFSAQVNPKEISFTSFTGISHNILPIQDESAKIKINLRLKSITEFNLAEYTENKFKPDNLYELISREIHLIQAFIINRPVTPRSPPNFLS